MTKFGPKLIFCSIWARPCRLIQCPVGGSVGGCGARAVSRKTPIYFILLHLYQDLTRLIFKRGLEEFVERSSSLHETGMWEENGATGAQWPIVPPSLEGFQYRSLSLSFSLLSLSLSLWWCKDNFEVQSVGQKVLCLIINLFTSL